MPTTPDMQQLLAPRDQQHHEGEFAWYSTPEATTLSRGLLVAPAPYGDLQEEQRRDSWSPETTPGQRVLTTSHEMLLASREQQHQGDALAWHPRAAATRPPHGLLAPNSSQQRSDLWSPETAGQPILTPYEMPGPSYTPRPYATTSNEPYGVYNHPVYYAYHPRAPRAVPVNRLHSTYQRTGTWTPEELAYTDKITEVFHLGLLPNCPDRITIRVLIAAVLNCDPMRITKKYTGDKKVGKFEYKGRGVPLGARLEAELRDAETSFHSSLIGGTHELIYSVFPTPGLASIIHVAHDALDDYFVFAMPAHAIELPSHQSAAAAQPWRWPPPSS